MRSTWPDSSQVGAQSLCAPSWHQSSLCAACWPVARVISLSPASVQERCAQLLAAQARFLRDTGLTGTEGRCSILLVRPPPSALQTAVRVALAEQHCTPKPPTIIGPVSIQSTCRQSMFLSDRAQTGYIEAYASIVGALRLFDSSRSFRTFWLEVQSRRQH